MSSLARFRKPGGFAQLLALIESCEPEKQKTLLHLVGVEDPGWAHLVKIKTISFDRILSWPTEILMEITSQLPDRILAVAATTLHDHLREKWLASLPRIKRTEIVEMAVSLKVNPNEVAAAQIKIIKTVREMAAQGRLNFSQFDPSLMVDQKIAA